jgi:tRNA uridine 5-carbamoylmethylation protein Kti12
MDNILILVSGMPGVGKTSFAKWLSSEMRIPLVCYDHVVEKFLHLSRAVFENDEQFRILRGFPDGFMWFFCEEIMKSSSPLIFEYFFTEQMKEEKLNDLVDKYKYQTINVHLDASTEVAHRRYQERNQNNQSGEGLKRPEISFEQFDKGTKANKDFRYGDRIIYVDTTDFSTVSYDDISKKIRINTSE